MTNTKNEINILVTATDNASSILNQTSQSLSSLSNTSAQLSKIREENKTKIIASAWTAFAWLSIYFKEWVKDINAYNYSVERLWTLMKNSTWATPHDIQLLTKQAEALSKVWVATKENIVAWMSQFATFDLSRQAIWRLTSAYIDYVVAERGVNATTQDYISMANSLAQALNGNYSSLTRTWFILDDETKSLIKNWDELQKINAIVKVLNSTYKDYNKTIAATVEWQKAMLSKALNNIRENITISFLPVIERVLSIALSVTTAIAERTEKHPKLSSVIFWVTTALVWFVAILGSLSVIIPFISTALTVLLWPIWAIIAALTVFSAAYTTNFMGFQDTVESVRKRLEPIFYKIADTLLKTLEKIFWTISWTYEKLEPILSAFREKHWEKITIILALILELFVSTFAAIWEVVVWLISTISEVLDFISNIASWNREAALENLKNITSIWIEGINNIFLAFWIDIQVLFEKLKDTLIGIRNTLFNSLKETCSSAVNRISDKISKIREKISTAKDAVSNLRNGSSGSSPSWWRASWWLVLAWQTYRVNEIHWEYFTPSVNGRISPINQTTTPPSISINFTWNINLTNQADENRFAEKVRNVVMECYQNLSLWYV